MGRIIHGGLRVNAIDKPMEWTMGFFFGNTELSLELWNVIAGISGFRDLMINPPYCETHGPGALTAISRTPAKVQFLWATDSIFFILVALEPNNLT